MENSEQLFSNFNLNPNTIASILKNAKVVQKLTHLINLSGET